MTYRSDKRAGWLYISHYFEKVLWSFYCDQSKLVTSLVVWGNQGCCAMVFLLAPLCSLLRHEDSSCAMRYTLALCMSLLRHACSYCAMVVLFLKSWCACARIEATCVIYILVAPWWSKMDHLGPWWAKYVWSPL